MCLDIVDLLSSKVKNQPPIFEAIGCTPITLLTPFCTCIDANHDPPEIHRLVPNYGSSSGGETIAIIGTRMHSRK